MSAMPLHEHLADRAVLLINGLAGIYSHELEDFRQSLIFLDDAPDEHFMALVRVLDVGDVLAGLIVAWLLMRSCALSGDIGRQRKIENHVGPEQRNISVHDPAQVQAARRIAG